MMRDACTAFGDDNHCPRLFFSRWGMPLQSCERTKCQPVADEPVQV